MRSMAGLILVRIRGSSQDLAACSRLPRYSDVGSRSARSQAAASSFQILAHQVDRAVVFEPTRQLRARPRISASWVIVTLSRSNVSSRPRAKMSMTSSAASGLGSVASSSRPAAVVVACSSASRPDDDQP